MSNNDNSQRFLRFLWIGASLLSFGGMLLWFYLVKAPEIHGHLYPPCSSGAPCTHSHSTFPFFAMFPSYCVPLIVALNNRKRGGNAMGCKQGCNRSRATIALIFGGVVLAFIGVMIAVMP